MNKQKKILISIENQRIFLVSGEQILKEWPISSAANGTGFEPGSHKTPLGNFAICEKFGQGMPENAVFESRKFTGFWGEKTVSDDFILARIFWLDGLDEANSNTKMRYIYIHGTNVQHLLGQPVSHGCIRMNPSDIIELYEDVTVGTRVEIF